ncbi:Glucanosyltransferase-domain-containing protein [Pilobolus umbonatus]|nr:Glucanosyltransferase-domain-containing protein [Pilobolus umbonatus]
MRISAIILLVTACSSVHALNKLTIKGSKIFDSVTKEQFFIKGVAYQPRGEIKDNTMDPLADPAACARDAKLMKEIGTNVLRVYEVDSRRNHDACMKSFANEGIYLLLDIGTPKYSINRKTPEYNVHLYNAYKSTVDAFLKYDNIMGFIAGNEVTNDKTNTEASAYVKAALRDIKTYVQKTRKKDIPVGYASNDDEFIRDEIKDYFNCGDEDSQADFFGINLYEWCGDSSFEKSGFKERTMELESYSKPVFLSEYGCNLVSPREFTEVGALYGPKMTHVWSGGIVYEWSQENNRYGLVKFGSTGEPEILDDYNNFKVQMKNTKPVGVRMDSYNPQLSASHCPSISDTWKASNSLPPTPSEGACECMVQNLECIASDNVISDDSHTGTNTVGAQMDAMCGITPCDEIGGNPQTGKYGAYSFCSARDKLSWLYNQKAREIRGSNACNFNGYGQLVKPKRSDLSSCALIKPNIEGLPDQVDEKKSTGTYQVNGVSKILLCLSFALSWIIN